MPIDFHTNMFFVNNNHPVLQSFAQGNFLNANNSKDLFVKNVKVVDVKKLYDGVKVTKKSFGEIEKTGEVATLYTITNKNGASVDLSTFGATIVGVKVPDKDGNIIDVAQGYSSVTPYEKSPIGHAGGTIGPIPSSRGEMGAECLRAESGLPGGHGRIIRGRSGLSDHR